MTRTWTAVTVTAAPELAEGIESFLLDQGAPGLQTEEADGQVSVTAHFAGAAPLAALDRFCDAMPELFPGTARPQVRVAAVADNGWAENWKTHFPPLAVGDRLFVHPPWIAAIPEGRIGIVIDPGMAFGTGHHASTLGCLRLLERAMRARSAPRVLDLGTGSGILAIAAVKLGAREVWAVDVDPQACEVAAENAAANGVRDAIRIRAAGDAPGAFDIVVANLLAGVLVDLAERIVAYLVPGGLAIGSGILAEEAAAVRAAWDAAGLRSEDEHGEDGWVTLVCRRAS